MVCRGSGGSFGHSVVFDGEGLVVIYCAVFGMQVGMYVCSYQGNSWGARRLEAPAVLFRRGVGPLTSLARLCRVNGYRGQTGSRR